MNSLPRRDLLQIGSLGPFGLMLPDLLRAAAGTGTRRAKSCLLFFLEGGPAQQDMWDMKPDAPSQVRGPFRPIDSTVPGVQLCEHLPRLSQQMHRATLIRSVHHTINDHNAGAYYLLTGRSPLVGGRLIVREDASNFPPFGSVTAHVRPSHDMPEFVHIPEIMFNNGAEIPGEKAGFLGPGFDPLVAGDPSDPKFRVPGLAYPRDVTRRRVENRRDLLQGLDRVANGSVDPSRAGNLDEHYRKAFSLLATPRARRAFDIEQEPAALRERYGLPDRSDRSVPVRKFGGLPHLGQSLLLARRLIEAGVGFVTVCTGRRYEQTWDGHRQHFSLLERSILPYFDRAFSTLLSDMDDRGLLDETLVVAMGEFGRTPKIGQITSSAGATPEGRDHWPACFTILVAGAGVQAGTVFGSSDRHAAYPASRPVTPEDVATTIYDRLGIDPSTHVHDPAGRPHVLATGERIPIFDG